MWIGCGQPNSLPSPYKLLYFSIPTCIVNYNHTICTHTRNRGKIVHKSSSSYSTMPGFGQLKSSRSLPVPMITSSLGLITITCNSFILLSRLFWFSDIYFFLCGRGRLLSIYWGHCRLCFMNELIILETICPFINDNGQLRQPYNYSRVNMLSSII